MDRIHLLLVTSDGGRWEHMVSSIILPTPSGFLGILANHAPMLCAVGSGRVTCRFGEGESLGILVSDGIANVADNEVTLLLSQMTIED